MPTRSERQKNPQARPAERSGSIWRAVRPYREKGRRSMSEDEGQATKAVTANVEASPKMMMFLGVSGRDRGVGGGFGSR